MTRFFISPLSHLQKNIMALGLILALISPVYGLNSSTAAGMWYTIDPKTKSRSSVVTIWQDPKTQHYNGKITRIFLQDGHRPIDRCVHCQGELKNKPMLGLVIVKDMVNMGDGYYRQGRVLDPRNGKVYHAQMRLTGHGQMLKLRGYVLMPLLGRTDTWYRVLPGQDH